MNYYRRYIADYLSKTLGLSMVEDGAYTRMLDYIYANEKPLPPDLERVYDIVRVRRAIEQKAVDVVLAAHFELAEDGYHNVRADKELGIAVPKIDKLRETARTNGAKGGRPKKTRTGYENETGSGSSEKPEGEPALVPETKQPPTASHQPESNPPSGKRFPGRDTTGESAGTFAAASMKNLQPPGPEANVETENSTPAGMLAAVLLRNQIKATAFHPLVVDWARDGVTVEGIRAAIATARLRKPAPDNIPLAYLQTILADKSRPVDSSWKRDDAKAAALCSELGIPGPKRGELSPEFHGRIEQALAERARSQVS